MPFATRTGSSFPCLPPANYPSRHARAPLSYRRIRVRPVTPATRIAHCKPRSDRRKTVPAVQLPSGEQLAMSLRPNFTGSEVGASPSGPGIVESTATWTPGNSCSTSCTSPTQRSNPSSSARRTPFALPSTHNRNTHRPPTRSNTSAAPADPVMACCLAARTRVERNDAACLARSASSAAPVTGTVTAVNTDTTTMTMSSSAREAPQSDAETRRRGRLPSTGERRDLICP